MRSVAAIPGIILPYHLSMYGGGSEQWTFDIIHLYYRFSDMIAKVNVIRHCGMGKD